MGDNRRTAAPAANNRMESLMTRWSLRGGRRFAGFLCSAASADEGMWTFHGFPFDKANAPLKTKLDQAWLDRVRAGHRAHRELHGLVRLQRRPDPRPITIAWSPASPNSRARKRASSRTATSRRRARRKCVARRRSPTCSPSMEDITAKIAAATAGKDDAAANEARKAALTQLEQQCETTTEAQVPERLAVRRRPVLAVQVQALHRPAPGVRARGRHRRVRRRPGQFPVPALVPRHGHPARLRERRARASRLTT